MRRTRLTVKAAFYLSTHGLGHVTRMIAVMQALRRLDPQATIHVRTAAPPWIFEREGLSLQYGHRELDTGVVEVDIFRQDGRATLERYAALSGKLDALVAEEAGFVRENAIDVIVSDIPPVASRVGWECGVPVVAISNFSWDYIYARYVRDYPEYSWILDEIGSYYRLTSLLLRLPFHHEMTAFPVQRDISLVARSAPRCIEQARSELGLTAEQRPVVLVGGRMTHLAAVAGSDVVTSGEFRVLVLADDPVDLGRDVTVLPPGWKSRFLELLALSDVLVAKIGYGVVSDCIACRTALVYPPRFDFPEFDLLTGGISGILPAAAIDEGAYLGGTWRGAVERALRSGWGFAAPALDGAEQAAAVLLKRDLGSSPAALEP